MNKAKWFAILLILIPAIVIPALGLLMGASVGRGYVNDRIENATDVYDKRALHSRITGYDTDAVANYWGALDSKALSIETRFLETDLIFPLAYGAILYFATRAGRKRAYRKTPATWPMVAIPLGVVADWTENVTQLVLLNRYQLQGPNALDMQLISIASSATQMKWLFVILSIAYLLFLSRRAWTQAEGQIHI